MIEGGFRFKFIFAFERPKIFFWLCAKGGQSFAKGYPTLGKALQRDIRLLAKA
jgi:hypothetical protein